MPDIGSLPPWTWWVEVAIQALVALATIGAVGVSLWVAFDARKREKEAVLRETAAIRRSDELAARQERLDMAKTISAYLARWGVGASRSGPDQKNEMMPQAARTGQGATDLAQWAADGVTVVNENSKGNIKLSNDRHWRLKGEAQALIAAWISDPATRPSEPFRLED